MQLLAKNRDKKIKKYENTISETQTNIDKVFKEIGIHDTEVKEKQNLIKNKDSNEKRLKETLSLEKQLETAKKIVGYFEGENADLVVCDGAVSVKIH